MADNEDRTREDDHTLEESKTSIPRPSSEEVPDSAQDSVRGAPPKLELEPAKTKAGGGKGKLLGNLVFVLGFVATLVLGYFVGQWIRVKFGDTPQPETGERYKVELRGDEPQLGPDDALVTIIEFADFQCPYCADSVDPLKRAMAAYEGDVRLIFKHYPLPGHRLAGPAAKTAWAAHQQGQFWEFHDRLFESKSSIEPVPEWVKELGLDPERLGSDMESAKAAAAVDSDMLAGAKVGVTGTPAFFVNGHLYRGKRDEVGWKQIIEFELDHAKDLVDDGVAREQVYEHLMKDAKLRQEGAPDKPLKPRRKPRPGEPDDESVYAVPVAGAPAKGPADALVTIVEFADYHCGYCARVAPTIDEIAKAYPEQVRVVYRQRPLAIHPQARDASKAALAAGKQDKYWEMHEKLFLRQAKTLDEFKGLAAELGLDVERFVADYESEEIGKQVAEDMQIADKFGVTGTPAFFINGRYISGAQSYAVFDQMVREQLELAQKKIDAGTPASGVYAAILAEGKKSARE